jgi:hypothetical protein
MFTPRPPRGRSSRWCAGSAPSCGSGTQSPPSSHTRCPQAHHPRGRCTGPGPPAPSCLSRTCLRPLASPPRPRLTSHVAPVTVESGWPLATRKLHAEDVDGGCLAAVWRLMREDATVRTVDDATVQSGARGARVRARGQVVLTHQVCVEVVRACVSAAGVQKQLRSLVACSHVSPQSHIVSCKHTSCASKPTRGRPLDGWVDMLTRLATTVGQRHTTGAAQRTACRPKAPRASRERCGTHRCRWQPGAARRSLRTARRRTRRTCRTSLGPPCRRKAWAACRCRSPPRTWSRCCCRLQG